MRFRNSIYHGVMFFVIILFVLNSNLCFGYIFGNGSGGVYDEGDSGGEVASITCSNTIEYYVIEGAGYYLGAYTDILQFLHDLELSYNRVDRAAWLPLLDRAVLKLDWAAAMYDILIKTAEVTPYDNTALDKLRRFDYTGYMTANSLNPYIFEEVEQYLGAGDVTGAYRRIRAGFTNMKTLLKQVRTQVYYNRFPVLADCWKLNELCSTTLLFGQYMAGVCTAL